LGNQRLGTKVDDDIDDSDDSYDCDEELYQAFMF